MQIIENINNVVIAKSVFMALNNRTIMESTISNEIHNPDLDGLSKLLAALEPWLPQNVIVGG